MRKGRCVKGHFYDLDASTLCPHCGSQEAKEEPVAIVSEDNEVADNSKKMFGFFGKMKPSKDVKNSVMAEPQPSENPSVVKEPVQSIKKSVSNTDSSEMQKTRPFWSFEEETVEEEVIETQDFSAATSEPRQHRDIDSVKTTSIYTNKDGGEPVTGWLVCIEGAHYGQSFEIKAGQSTIGRDSSMDICMKKEGSISREKHAYIIFEPKKRQFLLRSGEGKGLTYCNDDLVTGIVPLNGYDKVQLGEAEFLFVPFCNEKFMWEKAEK